MSDELHFWMHILCGLDSYSCLMHVVAVRFYFRARPNVRFKHHLRSIGLLRQYYRGSDFVDPYYAFLLKLLPRSGAVINRNVHVCVLCVLVCVFVCVFLWV